MKPLPDELIYSVACRLASLVGSAADGITLHNAFLGPQNPKNVFIRAGTPATQRLLGIEASELLMSHSVLPFYLPFCGWASKLRKVSSGLSGAIFLQQGSIAYRCALRYCPACAREDRERYGVAYWRRSDTLPSVHVCPRHNQRLVQIGPIRDHQLRFHFLPGEENPKFRLEDQSPVTPGEIRLATLSRELVGLALPRLNDKWVEQVLRDRLRVKGVRSGSRRCIKRIYDLAVEEFSEPLLLRLGLPFVQQAGFKLAIRKIFGSVPGRPLHPIGHLLLIGVLYRSVREFYEQYVTRTRSELLAEKTHSTFPISALLSAHHGLPWHGGTEYSADDLRQATAARRRELLSAINKGDAIGSISSSMPKTIVWLYLLDEDFLLRTLGREAFDSISLRDVELAASTWLRGERHIHAQGPKVTPSIRGLIGPAFQTFSYSHGVRTYPLTAYLALSHLKRYSKAAPFSLRTQNTWREALRQLPI